MKQSVTTRQAAEYYGIHVGRNGMACCPFHNDKTPSMKLDRRYHCFGCGADGDVIDFAAALYGLERKKPPYSWHRTSGFPMRTGNRRKGKKAQDPAEIPGGTVSGSKESLLPYSCRLSPFCRWHGERTTPRTPRRKPFIPGLWEALQKQAQVEYLLDVLLFGGNRGKSGFDYGLRKGCDTA